MKNKKQDGLVGGFILISIGVVALLGQVVDFAAWENVGVSFVLLLGLIFLAWGIFSRQAGPMIPGGIISGIGLGIILLANNLVPTGIEEGGIFLMAFALGWGLITLLSALLTNDPQWWPLIPGGIIGFIGLAVSFGGVFMNLLTVAAQLWPVILIVVGVYVLWSARKPKEKSLKEL